MEMQLKLAQRLAALLDNQFELFGVQFGLDAVFGIVPVAGDTVALLLSLYIVSLGWQLDMPQRKKLQLLLNVGIDYALDYIPIIGDVSWIVYKPNLRNMAIIKEYAPAKTIEGEVVAQKPRALFR